MTKNKTGKVLQKNIPMTVKKTVPAEKLYRSPVIARIWSTLLPQVKSRESGWFYRNGIWEMAALMLLGMYLFKIGFFNGQF